MISKELMALLVQIISSWQVIAVTIVIVVYFSLVSFVAQVYQQPRFVRALSSRKKKKKKKDESAAPVPAAESGTGDVSNDDLGLEEA